MPKDNSELAAMHKAFEKRIEEQYHQP